VNPDGPGLVLCEWPWSITAMTSAKQITRGRREDTKRHMSGTSALAVPVPRAKRSQIRVSHKPQKIAEFRDVQLAISIPVRHLEFRFEKAQQLRLAYRAFVVAAGSFSGIVSHGQSQLSTALLNSLQATQSALSEIHCPSHPIKTL
jgi:hypothetical protein